MRGKRSKGGVWYVIYIGVRMYTSHSIKQMARGVREGQILRNKRDRGVGQSESNGEEIWVVWKTK